MYRIQTNAKGSRFLDIAPEHLETIEHYSLLSDLLDSNGIVDDSVVEKLRLNVRALLEQTNGANELLTLCHDVLFHDNMKAYGLHELIVLYLNWKETKKEQNTTQEEA